MNATALLAVAATLVLAFWAPQAAAQERLPDGNAGTGQYIEPVPDAEGDRPARPRDPGSGGGGGGGLPPRTRDRLPGGAEGEALARIAGDSGSGAPAGAAAGDAGGESGGGDGSGGGRGGGRGGDDGASSDAAGEDDESAISAVLSAATGSDGAGVPLLLVALLGVTLAVAAGALRIRGRS